MKSIVTYIYVAAVAAVLLLLLNCVSQRLASGASANLEPFDFLTDPQLKRGDRFYLRHSAGFVSVCYDCRPKTQNLETNCASVLCVTPYPTRSSVWVYHPHDDGTFSVSSETTGKYWKRCNNCIDLCPNVVCSDGVNGMLQPARFELIKLGNDVIQIKTDIGTFLDLTECEQSCGKVVTAVGNGEFLLEPIKSTAKKLARTVSTPAPVNGYAPISIPFTE